MPIGWLLVEACPPTAQVAAMAAATAAAATSAVRRAGARSASGRWASSTPISAGAVPASSSRTVPATPYVVCNVWRSREVWVTAPSEDPETSGPCSSSTPAVPRASAHQAGTSSRRVRPIRIEPAGA